MQAHAMKALLKGRGALMSIAAVLSIASAGAAAAQDWDQVKAAANTEGVVEFLHNVPGKGAEPLIADFNKEFPNIKVEQVRLASNAVNERFATEYGAGRHLWDVVFSVTNEQMLQGVKSGQWALKWTPPEISNFRPDFNHDGYYFTAQTSHEVLAWNKNLLSDADAPKKWADLIDPRFKGQVGMTSPWRTATMSRLMYFIENNLGIKDMAERLKANDVRFFEGSGGVYQALLRGDIKVAEISDLINPMLAEGAPIGVLYPKEGTIMNQHVLFLAKDAPHPNAAKIFLNWLLSEKGQADLQNYGGMISARNGSLPPSNLPANSQIPNLVMGDTLLGEDQRMTLVNHWREVFGQ